MQYYFFVAIIAIVLVSGCAQENKQQQATPSSQSFVTPVQAQQSMAAPNQLSEQPNKAKFDEYFSDFYLSKLPIGQKVGPPNFPTKTSTFTAIDQFCSSGTLLKEVPSGSFGYAVFDTVSKQYNLAKSVFPIKLSKGGFAGCEDLKHPKGIYEYKVYIDNVLVAVLPFEVK